MYASVQITHVIISRCAPDFVSCVLDAVGGGGGAANESRWSCAGGRCSMPNADIVCKCCLLSGRQEVQIPPRLDCGSPRQLPSEVYAQGRLMSSPGPQLAQRSPQQQLGSCSLTWRAPYVAQEASEREKEAERERKRDACFPESQRDHAVVYCSVDEDKGKQQGSARPQVPVCSSTQRHVPLGSFSTAPPGRKRKKPTLGVL